MSRKPRATVVTGIVRSVGAHTGWPRAGDGPTLVLLLTPWLRGGQTRPLDGLLRVQVPVAKPEVDRAMKAFASGFTVQLELEQLEGPARGQWSGRGRLPVRRVEPDSTLEAFRQLIERPTTLEDPRLGRLTLTPGAIIPEYNDQQMADTYDGQVRLGGQPCALSIELTRNSRSNTRSARARDRRDIAKAAALVVRLDKGLPKLLRGIARDALATFGTGRRGHRPALTADNLRQRLAPSSLLVSGNGAARLILTAGDLLGGQSVLSFLDKTGALSKTWLARWK